MKRLATCTAPLLAFAACVSGDNAVPSDGATRDATTETAVAAIASQPEVSSTDSLLGADFYSSVPNSFVDSSGRLWTNSATMLSSRLPLRAGDRLIDVGAMLVGDDVVDAMIDIRKVTAGGISSSIGSANVTNIESATPTIDVVDTSVGIGESVLAIVWANAAQLGLINMRYTYNWVPRTTILQQ